MSSAENPAEKYDVKRALKALYAPSARDFSRVVVPPMQYLAVDGHGDPNTAPAYAESIEALYGVAYTLKFASKKALGRDFVVAPLEGLWRAADATAFTRRDKAAWEWTMLIHQPDWVTAAMVDAARAEVLAKKGLAAAGALRLLRLDEGESVQILHVGSYDDEAPTLARLHDEYLPAHGL
ncbi:GyrI-like domain-containing protein, partial [Microterricola pindariensis]